MNLEQHNVWINTGIIIVYGANLDARSHLHYAMQLVWPHPNQGCEINGQHTTNIVLIDSERPHQLRMLEGWLMLVEPQSQLGGQLKRKLDYQSMEMLPPPDELSQTSQLSSLLSLLNRLDLTVNLEDNHALITDGRIKQIVQQLEQDFAHQPANTDNLRAIEIATQLQLSESRFLHLFTNQMKIPWRHYILWRRMICAIKALKAKHSATEAAHLAGFSDSAHLSRTFKAFFGITIRQAKYL